MAVSDMGVDISLQYIMVHSSRPIVLNVNMVFYGGLFIKYSSRFFDPGPTPNKRLLKVQMPFRASLSPPLPAATPVPPTAGPDPTSVPVDILTILSRD